MASAGSSSGRGGMRNKTIAVAVADAVLLMVGLVGVFAVGSSGGESGAVRSIGAGGTTSTVVAATTTTPPPTEPVVAGPGPSSAPTKKGTAKPTSPAKGAGTASGSATPPKDGTYRTKVHSESTGSSARTSDNEIAVKITTVSSKPGEVQQRSDVEGSKGGGAGATSGSGSIASWRPDGVYRQSGGNGSSFQCTPPEQLEIKLPLAVGSSWQVKADCTFTSPDGKQSGKTHVEATTKVLGSRMVAAAGKQVSVWEFASDSTSTSTTSFNGQPQTFSTTSKSTSLFAPVYGQTVHSEGTTTANFGGQTSDSSVRSDLQNLDPQ